MFQDINVTKSAPFALLTKYQNSLYPPKDFKIAPILANYAKFADHFSIYTTRNGNLKYHSKLREIRSIRQRQQRMTQNPRDYCLFLPVLAP